MRNLLGMPAGLLRAAARVLLVTLSVSALGPVAHGMHEEECEGAFVFHDESQHHVQSAPPSPVAPLGDHCVACHFARSSRGPVSWEPSGLAALDAGVLLYHTDGCLTMAPAAALRSPRAPPHVP